MTGTLPDPAQLRVRSQCPSEPRPARVDAHRKCAPLDAQILRADLGGAAAVRGEPWILGCRRAPRQRWSHGSAGREKLEDQPDEPRYIRTVRGVGYTFAEI